MSRPTSTVAAACALDVLAGGGQLEDSRPCSTRGADEPVSALAAPLARRPLTGTAPQALIASLPGGELRNLESWARHGAAETPFIELLVRALGHWSRAFLPDLPTRGVDPWLPIGR